MKEKVDQIRALTNEQLERSIIDELAYGSKQVDNLALFDPNNFVTDGSVIPSDQPASKRQRLEAILYTLQMEDSNE